MLRHREPVFRQQRKRKTFFVRLDSRTLRRATTLVPVILALTACGKSVAEKDAEARSGAHREKYARAQALFEERCKTAGVVIKRTVKDVEGIELIKTRQPIPWGGEEYFDPMYPEAAMAGEHRGNDYINQFLMTESIDKQDPDRRGNLNSPDFDAGPRAFSKRGYQFVEVVDAKTQMRLRGQLGVHPAGTNLWVKAPDLMPVSKSATRYALDYEDIVDPDDRQLWIAGTKLKIIDKQEGEVIAVMTRYVWEAGFGGGSTGRWPWEHANASGRSQTCPYHAGARDDISRKFADTVLVPKQRN